MESTPLVDTLSSMPLRFELGAGDAEEVVRDSADLTAEVDTVFLVACGLGDPDDLAAVGLFDANDFSGEGLEATEDLITVGELGGIEGFTMEGPGVTKGFIVEELEDPAGGTFEGLVDREDSIGKVNIVLSS